MTNPNTFAQIDAGTGELVVYPDLFAAVTDELVERAEQKEGEVLFTKKAIEHGFLVLAELLDEFERDRMYLARGFESMSLWSESPQIDLSWRLVQDLIRIVREVLPLHERRPELPAPEAIGISKTRALLPLLRLPDGEDRFVAKAQEVVEAEWTWRDTVAEVKAERGNPERYDAEKPALFVARVRGTRVEVRCTTGADHYTCGVLNVKPQHLPRLEALFGRFVEHDT